MIYLCLLACAVLVYAEYASHARRYDVAPSITASSAQLTLGSLRVAAKITASIAFVVHGARAFGASPFHSWMVIGLVLGAVGDVALLGRSNRAFVGGLAAFLAGHIAYIIALAQLESPLYWIPYAGRLGIITVAGGFFALRWLWPNLGALKLPVVLYVLAIVAMVVGAFAVQSTGGLPAPERDYLAIGAALFFLSDLAVARDKFMVRELENKLYGLPAYYVAQLLIASAIR